MPSGIRIVLMSLIATFHEANACSIGGSPGMHICVNETIGTIHANCTGWAGIACPECPPGTFTGWVIPMRMYLYLSVQ